MEIRSLLDDLVARGVSEFSGYGIAVKFHRPSQGQLAGVVRLPVENWPTSKDPSPSQNPEQPQSIDPAAAGLAQSLDAELGYDQIRDWSASPDPNDQSTPLTGDDHPLANIEGIGQ